MRLLLVEDKESFRRLLVQALGVTSWDVLAVGDPQEGLEALQSGAFEILVTDLRLPTFSGLELLKRAKQLQPGLRVVLMSAFGEPRDIVEAVRWGADDFLPKPFDLDAFLLLLQRLGALVEAPPPDPREPWVIHSPAMSALEQALARTASSQVSVLFEGARGVGKARTARRLHVLRRPLGPFLALRAETLGPDGPSQRHLHLLKEGSLYLADLEGLPRNAIAPLLHAMESEAGQQVAWMAGCQDAATLDERLRDRCGVLTFHVPTLSERREDIIPLFRSLLAWRVRQLGRSMPLVDRALERNLVQRTWPANIRDMAWCVDQALQATQGATLAPLPEVASGGRLLTVSWPEQGTLDARLQQVHLEAEAALLKEAVREFDGNLSQVGARLGIPPRTLAQRLREHRISLEDGR